MQKPFNVIDNDGHVQVFYANGPAKKVKNLTAKEFHKQLKDLERIGNVKFDICSVQDFPDYHVDSEKDAYWLSALDLGIYISKDMAEFIVSEVKAKKHNAHNSKIIVRDNEGDTFKLYISQIMRILDPKDHCLLENEAFENDDDRYIEGDDIGVYPI